MTTLLSDLRGAQISIICALLISKRPMSNQELGEETGYRDPRAIALGVRQLSARGMVVLLGNHANKNAWALTDSCRQMFLPVDPPALPQAPAQLESGENRNSLGGSGSESYRGGLVSLGHPPLQLQEESGDFRNSPAWGPVFARLLSLGTDSESKIVAALGRRAAHGETPAEVMARIAEWLQYFDATEWHPQNAGNFITSRIGPGYAIPWPLGERPAAQALADMAADMPPQAPDAAQAQAPADMAADMPPQALEAAQAQAPADMAADMPSEWRAALAALRPLCNPAAFQAHLVGTTLVWRAGLPVVIARSAWSRDWLTNKMAGAIARALGATATIETAEGAAQ